MPQSEFVMRFGWRKPARFFQASTLKAEHPEIRAARVHTFGGVRISHSVGTGRYDRGKLDITSPEVSSYVFRVPATAEGIKSVVRRIRPREAAELDAVDSDIEQLQTQLAELRERRTAALHIAWQRGSVVRLKEIEALLGQASA